jgi:hypothetical protein
MLKKQADTRGKSALSDQDFVEELALNEQEFGFDRALKAIENEVSSEGNS